MIVALVFSLSLLLSIVLVPFFICHAPKLGLIDYPDGSRKTHIFAIPRTGGLAIAISSTLPCIAISFYFSGYQYFIISCLIILVFGLLDDRFSLNYKWKFMGQAFASALFVWTLPELANIPFNFGEILPDYFIRLGLTVIIIAIINSINLIDGLDGLAGGISSLCLILISVLALFSGMQDVALLATALLGSVFGFLRFNTYPASVFMGDTGSQYIGFFIAALCVLLTQRPGSGFGSALPLLIIGIPLIDMILVMLIRVRRGLSPFHPDRNHLHHKLIDMGFFHCQVVQIMYFLQLFSLMLAYLLRFEWEWKQIFAFFVAAGIIRAITRGAVFIGWRANKSVNSSR